MSPYSVPNSTKLQFYLATGLRMNKRGRRTFCSSLPWSRREREMNGKISRWRERVFPSDQREGLKNGWNGQHVHPFTSSLHPSIYLFISPTLHVISFNGLSLPQSCVHSTLHWSSHFFFWILSIRTLNETKKGNCTNEGERDGERVKGTFMHVYNNQGLIFFSLFGFPPFFVRLSRSTILHTSL